MKRARAPLCRSSQIATTEGEANGAQEFDVLSYTLTQCRACFIWSRVPLSAFASDSDARTSDMCAMEGRHPHHGPTPQTHFLTFPEKLLHTETTLVPTQLEIFPNDILKNKFHKLYNFATRIQLYQTERKFCKDTFCTLFALC